MLTTKVYQLRDRVEIHFKENRPINLTVAFLALIMDVITEYAFAQSFGLLEVNDFNLKMEGYNTAHYERVTSELSIWMATRTYQSSPSLFGPNGCT